MTVKLLTGHDLEFLSLTGGFTGSSESTLVKMPHCWKSHAMAHMLTEISRNPEKNLVQCRKSRYWNKASPWN